MVDADSLKEKREVVYRHSGAVRVTHWVNVVALLVLLMSGLQIFNAHPALYLGSKSNFDDPVMAMRPIFIGTSQARISRPSMVDRNTRPSKLSIQ